MTLDDTAKIIEKYHPGLKFPLEWAQTMERAEDTAIILWNFLCELRLSGSTHVKSKIQDLCSDLCQYNRKSDDPLDYFLARINHHRLWALGRRIESYPQLAHVFTFDSAVDLSPFDENLLRDLLARGRVVSCVVGQALRSSDLPVFWVSPLEEVDGIASADEVNARLGLGFRLFYPSGSSEPTYLVKLKYPYVPVLSLRRPTAFCAGAHCYYRVNLDTGDEWGRTQSLETLERDLPEAVHDVIETTTGFVMEEVGWLETDLDVDFGAMLANVKGDFAKALRGDKK